MQMVYDYATFADQTVKIHGDRVLKHFDRFVNACLDIVALRVKRFTTQLTPAKDFQSANEALKKAAQNLMELYPDAKQVVVIVKAYEQPDDDRVMDFVLGLAKFKAQSPSA